MVEIFAACLIVILIGVVVYQSRHSQKNESKALDQLMLFHDAGRSMANHQLQMAQLDIEKRKTEVEIKRLDMEKMRAGSARRNNTLPMTASAGSGVDV